MIAKRHKRVALYVRVSTDHQSVRNQEIELQAVAERHGWTVVTVFKDQGISGAKGRDQRRSLERRSVGPIVDRSSWRATGTSRQARRLVPASARYRYHHAGRQGDVSNDGRICRVRNAR